MGWINAIRGPGEADPVDLTAETIINGTPYDARQPGHGSRIDPDATLDGLGSKISDEIKSRQRSLLVRYVATVRAR